MSEEHPQIINIGVVGGGDLCREILEKTTFDVSHEDAQAPILAVADPDPDRPGIALARQLGLLTFSDYHKLYDRRYNIHLIIISEPNKTILNNILLTRPLNIRVLSYDMFKVFWDAIVKEERKQREQATEIETILNGIEDFIVVITPEKKIAKANESFLMKRRFGNNNVIGKKCYEVMGNFDGGCDLIDTDCPLNEVVRNKRPHGRVIYHADRDGKSRYFEVSVFPIWEKGGKISKFIHISRDVTNRKREEEEMTRRLERMVEERTRQLKETHDKLLHQDKMASLGKLAASVVHEVNNPIAGILNLVMLMKRITDEGPITLREIEQFNRYLGLMETETRRIGRIVSNLLAFSRQSKMKLKRLNLNRLIETTLFLNANLLKIKRVGIKQNLDPDLPDVVGSEDQLEQVFMNFISNAAEAIDAAGGGRLEIKTWHSLKSNSIFVCFSDTGIGIPKENLPNLFDPFFTTKKKGKGVGLGLSVVYGIIKEHDGTINVSSKPNKGTKVTVELPLDRK